MIKQKDYFLTARELSEMFNISISKLAIDFL